MEKMIAVAVASLVIAAQAKPLKLPHVRFLGVYDDLQRKAWTKDGVPMLYKAQGFGGMLDKQQDEIRPNPDNMLDIVFEIARRKRNDTPSVAFRLSGIPQVLTSSWTYYDPVEQHDPSLWTAGIARPTKALQTDVSVGVADGKWSTVGRYRMRRNQPVYVSGLKFYKGIKLHLTPGGKPVKDALGGTRETGMEIQVILPSSISDKAFRVMAYDRKGEELPGGGSMTYPSSKLPSGYWFVGPIRSLARFELQTRPYEWTTFRNIALRARP